MRSSTRLNKEKYEGKTLVSNQGLEFLVIKYISNNEVLIRFKDTGYELLTYLKSATTGSVKDKLQPSVCGVGFIGGDYYNKKTHKDAYSHWHNMINRCYSPKYHIKKPTYESCEVCEDWQNFQCFAEWYYENKENKNGILSLDKDIRRKGNKLYSPENCSLVSPDDNSKLQPSCMYKFSVRKVATNEIINGYNQTDFAIEHGIDRRTLNSLLNGLIKTYRGLTLVSRGKNGE